MIDCRNIGIDLASRVTGPNVSREDAMNFRQEIPIRTLGNADGYEPGFGETGR